MAPIQKTFQNTKKKGKTRKKVKVNRKKPQRNQSKGSEAATVKNTLLKMAPIQKTFQKH